MTTAEGSQAASGGMGRASAILAAGTIVSRVLGFARGVILALAIGQVSSASANAFGVANQLPNNLYALVAGGVLSAVLVPQIVKAGLHADGGQKFINRIVTLGIVIFAIVTIAATFAAPALIALYTHQSGSGTRGFDAATIQLAITFAYWCLPQIFFYALYSLLSEVLNARRVFGPFTWAPVLNNVVSIAGIVLFMALFGGAEANRDPGVWSAGRIALLGSATTPAVPTRFPLEGSRARCHRQSRGLALRDGTHHPDRRSGTDPSVDALSYRRGRRTPEFLAHLHAAALGGRGVDRYRVLHPDERPRLPG